jgi:hypothetical protein
MVVGGWILQRDAALAGERAAMHRRTDEENGD